MKVKPEHLRVLETKIRAFLSNTGITVEGIREHYSLNGLSETRMLFDTMYAAGLSGWICDNLYPYLNDDHIKTALRKIFRNIEKGG